MTGKDRRWLPVRHRFLLRERFQRVYRGGVGFAEFEAEFDFTLEGICAMPGMIDMAGIPVGAAMRIEFIHDLLQRFQVFLPDG